LSARGIGDTDDLVQVTLKKTLDHLGTFEYMGEGSFLAYVRRIMLNEVRDQARRYARRPRPEDLTDAIADGKPSPLENAIGREALERYETALARLSRHAQEAIVLRVEYGFTYQETARCVNLVSSEAARQLVKRSLRKLAEEMARERT
jgi:RNA polymerase sigma-70 factor (ECF subfamily)